MVISWRLYAGVKLTASTELTGSTGFAFSNIDESGSAAGSPLVMLDLTADSPNLT